MTDFFLTGFPKKPRTRVRPASPVAEMGSRATVPSTVNLRVPAPHRSVPAEEGRGPVVPPQGLRPKLKGAAYQEKGISIKDLDHKRPFRAGDPSRSSSNPSAKGKEKQGLGETSQGERIQSFQGQSRNPGKNVILGESSKPAASPFGIPPASPTELPEDHPMKQEEGSLLHSSFLVVAAHGYMSVNNLVDYLQRLPQTTTKKFPDNWCNELENDLMSNRHFRKSMGVFTVCKDLGQPPSKRIVDKQKESSVAIGGKDKNLAERSHAGMSTGSEVEKRTPPLNLAVRTPRTRKPSDEDIDWTPSVEKLERAAAQHGGRSGPSQRQRASEPEVRNDAPLPNATKDQECAKTSGIWRCTLNALEGELYCARHMREQ